MNKAVIWIIIILLVVLGGWWLMHRSPSTTTTETTTGTQTSSTGSDSTTGATDNTTATSTPAVSGSVSGSVNLGSATTKEFTVTGGDFYFTPNTMTVNKGDTVKITFKNAEGTHDWVIDAFSARTPRIGSGQTATVSFVANKTGSFEYYCSVGEHRELGMKGTLVVK